MKFIEWIEDEGYKLEKIAEKLKISRMGLYNIMKGNSIPSLKLAVKIEQLTKGKVKCRDWVEDSDNPTDKHNEA